MLLRFCPSLPFLLRPRFFTATRMASHSTPTTPPPPHLVIVIAGPTAVGKSRIAQRLLKTIEGGVVLSADSVQVYRDVEIGANKPPRGSTERQTTVLLDIVENNNKTYSAGDWRRDALYALEKVTSGDVMEEDVTEENDDTIVQHEDDEAAARRRRRQIQSTLAFVKNQQKGTAASLTPPIIVGGTMMYLQWLVYGQPDAVQSTPEAVQVAHATVTELEASYQNDWPEVIAQTKSRLSFINDQQRDALHGALDKLSDNDWYRLRRIMEVAITHSSTDDRPLFDGTRHGGLLDEPSTYDVRCFFLCPAERMQHCHTMDERCERMLLHPSGSGLLQETVQLLLDATDDGDDAATIAPMVTKAIGYRQTLTYLRRPDPQPNDVEALQAYLADFCAATRRYAKKQMQWFRRDPHMYFVSVAADNDDTAALATIQRLVELPRDEYMTELLSESSSSAQTRATNEAQGKAMKFYQFQPMQPGSPEFSRLLEVADACTRQCQEHVATNSSCNNAVSDSWHLPQSSSAG